MIWDFFLNLWTKFQWSYWYVKLCRRRMDNGYFACIIFWDIIKRDCIQKVFLKNVWKLYKDIVLNFYFLVILFHNFKIPLAIRRIQIYLLIFLISWCALYSEGIVFIQNHLDQWNFIVHISPFSEKVILLKLYQNHVKYNVCIVNSFKL